MIVPSLQAFDLKEIGLVPLYQRLVPGGIVSEYRAVLEWKYAQARRLLGGTEQMNWYHLGVILLLFGIVIELGEIAKYLKKAAGEEPEEEPEVQKPKPPPKQLSPRAAWTIIILITITGLIWLTSK
jgi:hypothetical protein